MARSPWQGKTPPPPRSILENQGKTGLNLYGAPVPELIFKHTVTRVEVTGSVV